MTLVMLSLPESDEFLLSMVGEENYTRATTAIRALAQSRDAVSIKAQQTELLNKPAKARLQRELADAFKG